MSPLRFLQLDVFPASLGGGNPLGVVFGAARWDTAQMQHFARWTRLVETTFVLPPQHPQASYRVRIFTPYKEIPFAGHPSIGSAYAVLETGLAQPRHDQLLQECNAGLLPVQVHGSGRERELLIRTPPARITRERKEARDALAPILRDQPLGALGCALVEGGRSWWLAELADETQLRGWHPDHDTLAGLARSSRSMGLCTFARSHDDGYQLAVRAFPAGANIVEDPASGAANGLIAAWISQREPGGALAHGYRVSQGREIGHDARLVTRIDADGQVWVGGGTRIILDGRLDWPAGGASGPHAS